MCNLIVINFLVFKCMQHVLQHLPSTLIHFEWFTKFIWLRALGLCSLTSVKFCYRNLWFMTQVFRFRSRALVNGVLALVFQLGFCSYRVSYTSVCFFGVPFNSIYWICPNIVYAMELIVSIPRSKDISLSTRIKPKKKHKHLVQRCSLLLCTYNNQVKHQTFKRINATTEENNLARNDSNRCVHSPNTVLTIERLNGQAGRSNFSNGIILRQVVILYM